jgi:carbamoyl-phosphate synthase large subunit
LAKSPLKENFLLPEATEDEYPPALRTLIEREGVDLVIPNNDREVGRISELRDTLPCRTFLPHPETVALCHDKYRMYDRLTMGGIPVAKTYEIKSLGDIEGIMERLGGERFWVRPKTGSGSRGATWVETADQARAWIGLWVSLRGYRVEEFTISEFLPGRDYCFQSVWKDGRLLVGKLCERLAYFFGENKLSGMSSTPAVAVTLRDEAALESIFASIRLLDERPNGNFSFDLKGRADGVMCVTECNIGRFCMITPIYDRTGRYNTAQIHLLAALDRLTEIPEDPIDIEEDQYLIRELDTPPTIVDGQVLRRFERIRGDAGPAGAELPGPAAAWGRNA